MKSHYLYPLFFPKNIVIVGASTKPNMGVSLYLDTYKRYGYGINGNLPNIYPVNPKYEGKIIYGLWKCYKDLKSIPEPIDIVISCINAKYVPTLLRECINVKAKFLIIYTSGFSEVGDRGLTYSKELRKILENNKTTRVLGPNCFGSFNSQVDLSFSRFADMYPGGFSLFSQSGGFANRTIEISKKRGLGVNLGISVGNMIDIDMNDFLEFVKIDQNTNVIGFYLESVRDIKTGQIFLKNLKEITKKKPVVILKAGRTNIGKKACLSHTGAIAGSDEIYKSVFKQTGVISVKSSIEFYDICYLLSRLYPDKLIKGRNVCLIVPGGGNSVEMSDLLSEAGFNFPEISIKTQHRLEKLLYDVNTSFTNPIDVGAYGILPEMILNTTKEIINEKQFDIIIIILQISRILGLQFGYNKFTGSFARSLGRISKKTDKSFFVIPMVDEDNEKTIREYNRLKEVLNKFRIIHFPNIDRLVNALKYYLENYKI
ncbi:MAG: CoA-binding protein [Candidatus Helarchaeota archaeon]